MKFLVLGLCLLLGAAQATPIDNAQHSVDTLFRWLEWFVTNEEGDLMIKIVDLLKHVEDGIVRLKEIVPKACKQIHEEAERILDGLQEVVKELEDFFIKKKGGVYYGFSIMDELTTLTGGTKLGTALRVLQLAESAHKVMQDAKEFTPKFEKELNKIQGIIEKHVTDLATHVVKELGLDDDETKNKDVQKSVLKDIEDLMENLEEELHILALEVLKNIENTFGIIERKLPEVYEVLKDHIEEIRAESRQILHELRKTLQFGPFYGILDITADLTKGTSLGTVIRIANVIDKFNTVVQDARGFGPHAEAFLEHSVEKTAASAKDFLVRAAGLLMK